MFCPNCDTEYRDGIEWCSDCGAALVRERSSDQPSTDGSLVALAEERSFDLIAELLDRLEKADVPYVIEAGTALRLLDRPDETLEEPDPWEARVWVASSRLENARQVLREVDEQFGRRRQGDSGN